MNFLLSGCGVSPLLDRCDTPDFPPAADLRQPTINLFIQVGREHPVVAWAV